MSVIKKAYVKFMGLFRGKHDISLESAPTLDERMSRLERNYIILLKRVLEIDGIKFVSKTESFTHKIMQTPNDQFKGINEPEPTIH